MRMILAQKAAFLFSSMSCLVLSFIFYCNSYQ